MESLQKFIDQFNNNELDVELYFGDYETWFDVLKSRGLLHEIDPQNSAESWQNDFLLWLYNSDRENYYKWVEKFLSDVVVENGNAFWIGDRRDLADLFCDNRRNDISQETIRNILEGEDVFEPYHDTTDDVYRDVIEELSKENLELLKSRIIKELSNQELSPETEEMELIAKEQRLNDRWTINSENVSRILDDKESMESLLDGELTDLRADLYSIHSSAYNSAYESDVWEEIMGELDAYFETKKGEWIYQPHPYKKDTKIEKYKIPISDLSGLINDFLFANKGFNTGTIEYWGSLLGILGEDKECLSVRIPDYPDFRKVDKNINDFFPDYI